MNLSAIASEEPGVRGRQREATRAVVVAAALQLFAKRGFDGTALPAVAAASGVAVPLIVYHFKTKDGLWRACVDEVYARVEGHVDQFAQQLSKASGPGYYRLQIRAYVTALALHPEYMRIVFLEGMEASDRLEWLVANHQGRFTAKFVDLIKAAQLEGYIPAADPTYLKFVISGAMTLPIVLAAEYRLVDGTDALSPDFIERHIDQAVALLLPGLAR